MASKTLFETDLTALALDLRALAAAEVEAAYILEVRAYLNGETDEEPDAQLFGICHEEAQALVLEVLAIEVPEEGRRAA